MLSNIRRSFVWWLSLPLASACGNGESAPQSEAPVYSARELMNPEICRTCHLDYVQEWSQSMHAYASRDPVFLAMNRRGNEETGGALGNFCVRCHAPMAVASGATTDGLNLESLPASMQGVTCYFCHNAKAVLGTHNNPVELDAEKPVVMRAGISDPFGTGAHSSESSPLLTGSEKESASLCGACHDIVLPSPPAPAPVDGTPIELERTFLEWQSTLFAPGNDSQNPHGVTCGGCHMPPPARGAEGMVAPGTGHVRKLHDHVFAGVDVALDGPYAGGAAPLNEAQVQGLLDSTLRVANICVEYPADASDEEHIRLLVDIDNVGAGHAFPSGASQDRRAWLEVRVLLDENVVYTSGATASDADASQTSDADLVLFRDEALKVDGSSAHMFWDVASLSSHTIPGAVTRVVGAPGYDATHAIRSYPRAPKQWIDAPFDSARLRVELRIWVQPIAFEVLDDLGASGHLAQSLRGTMQKRLLLPNRNLSRPELVARIPELARFGEVSFEWSALTLNSPYFAPASSRSQGTSKFSCVGMNRGP